MSCDPFGLANGYIQKLRDLEREADGFLDGVPNTLEDLLDCLLFGTSGRAGSVDQLDALSLDSLRGRLKTIFKAVEQGTDDTVGIARARESASVGLATSGLWMSLQPANTVYGLAIIRTNQALADAATASVLVARGREAIAAMRESMAEITASQREDLLDLVRQLQQDICPRIRDIVAELLRMEAMVGRTRSLGEAYCEGHRLKAKVEALLARVPKGGFSGVASLLQASSELDVVMRDLGVVQHRLKTAKVVLPAFEREFSDGGFVPETEQRYFHALAMELAKVCEEIKALSASRRFAEMVPLGPRVREVGLLIIDHIERPPAERVREVRDHAAAEPFRKMAGRYRDARTPRDGGEILDGIRSSIPAAIIQKSFDLETKLVDVEEHFAEVERFGQVISSAGSEFIGLAQEVVNTACTGALKLLLQKIGYDTLEKLYAEGLFGQLPTAIFQAVTTANRLVSCLKDALNGAAMSRSLPSGQRFALERAVDMLRTVERVDLEVASIAASLDQFGRQPPQAFLNDASDVLEGNLKAGLRGIGIVVGRIPGTEETPDGFLRVKDDSLVPDGMFVDEDGYLKVRDGHSPPPGYSSTSSGHVRVATL